MISHRRRWHRSFIGSATERITSQQHVSGASIPCSPVEVLDYARPSNPRPLSSCSANIHRPLELIICPCVYCHTLISKSTRRITVRHHDRALFRRLGPLPSNRTPDPGWKNRKNRWWGPQMILYPPSVVLIISAAVALKSCTRMVTS